VGIQATEIWDIGNWESPGDITNSTGENWAINAYNLQEPAQNHLQHRRSLGPTNRELPVGDWGCPSVLSTTWKICHL